jgi:hypothetical protein
MKKVKSILTKVTTPDQFHQAILAWHMTPATNGRPSPAELHFWRTIRTQINPDVCQRTYDWRDVKNWRSSIRQAQKQYYDRGTKNLTPLQIGQEVVVQMPNGQWKTGQIECVRPQPRSYQILEHETGRLIIPVRIVIAPNYVQISQARPNLPLLKP